MYFHHAHDEMRLDVVDSHVRRRRRMRLGSVEVQAVVDDHRRVQHDWTDSMLIVTDSTHVLRHMSTHVTISIVSLHDAVFQKRSLKSIAHVK